MPTVMTSQFGMRNLSPVMASFEPISLAHEINLNTSGASDAILSGVSDGLMESAVKG
jgi:hypothetical protein